MHRTTPTAVLTLACLLAAAAAATTMIASSVSDLTRRADVVVHATTLTKRCWRDERRLIRTTARVRVLEPWAGSTRSGQILEVTTLGGVVGDDATSVIGAPEFAPGEEVVLFLGRTGAASYGVLDLAQGKFEVVHAADGRERLTRRGLAGIHFLGDVGPEEASTLGELRLRVARAAIGR